jgi:hypothetical protein
MGEIAEEFKEMTVRIFLSRRNFSEGRCSMKITEDVRKFAAEQKLTEGEALKAGMEQRGREFKESGSGSLRQGGIVAASLSRRVSRH